MKCWKKFLLSFSLLVYPLLSGYTFPSDAPYLVINSNHGQNERVYFAQNLVQYLYVGDDYVISSYSSNLNGYTSSGVNIIWTPYSLPYYRENLNNVTVNISEVVENHLYPTDRDRISHNYELYMFAVLGGLMIICMMKK